MMNKLLYKTAFIIVHRLYQSEFLHRVIRIEFVSGGECSRTITLAQPVQNMEIPCAFLVLTSIRLLL